MVQGRHRGHPGHRRRLHVRPSGASCGVGRRSPFILRPADDKNSVSHFKLFFLNKISVESPGFKAFFSTEVNQNRASTNEKDGASPSNENCSSNFKSEKFREKKVLIVDIFTRVVKSVCDALLCLEVWIHKLRHDFVGPPGVGDHATESCRTASYYVIILCMMLQTLFFLFEIYLT